MLMAVPEALPRVGVQAVEGDAGPRGAECLAGEPSFAEVTEAEFGGLVLNILEVDNREAAAAG